MGQIIRGTVVSAVSEQGPGLGEYCSGESDDGEPNDDRLLYDAANGDRRAFQRLMERRARPLMVLATRITGNEADADEVVQEAFLKVWEMAPRWRTDGGARFSTWVYRVVLNASIDVRRRRPLNTLEEAGELADDGADGLDQAVARQRQVVVRQAMETLPQRQRTAVMLHYFGEISAPEAARILGLTVSAMEALLVRGKRGIRMALAQRGVTGLGDVL